LIKKNKEVRKKLSFLDDEENTFAKSDRNVSQSETLIAGHSSDQTHADATALSNIESSNANVLNSQCTEKSNNDTSPERNYASDIRNLTKKSLKLHSDIIPETDLEEDEEDVCNITFTQHLNQKLESDSQSSSLERSTRRSSKNAIITITTKYKPPSPGRIRESMTMYGIPKYRSQKPFFSNKLDLEKQKESLNTNASYFVPAFKSSLGEITSLKLWRRMKVNEFYPSGANIKSYHIKRTLAGYNSLTIKPLMEPPSSKDVRDWVRAKKYISKKNSDVKSCKQNKEKALNVQDVQHPSINAINEEIKSQPGTSNNLINNDSNVEGHIHLSTSHQSKTSDETRKLETQNSDNSLISENSLDPSLKRALENPLLHKQDKTQLRDSYGQIECSSKGSYGNVSNENLQKARAVTIVSVLF